jgi:DNA primase catalytic core
MKPITDWIKTELYPALYQSLDVVFPEFNFKNRGKYWVSTTKVKITGEEGESRGKVYVYENSPSIIRDYTRGSYTLIDYIIQRDSVKFIEAVKKLAEIVNLKIPDSQIDEEIYLAYKQRATLLEEANFYFMQSLNRPQEKGAEEVRAYLSGRGYTDEDIELIEVGYIRDTEKLYNYLQSKGYTEKYIDEELPIKIDNRIGSTHRLTIPYRSGGSLKCFKFRTIGDNIPKYINTKGLDRSGGFFNISSLKGDKDLVIVEGELDSLIATARGVKNVVAIGGSSITSDQIKDALKKGARSFTLCFDNEPEKADITAKNIASAIEIIREEGDYNVYIVRLPDLGGGKTDPDKRIIKSGVEALKNDIIGALPYWEYLLIEILNKYGKIAEQLNFNGLLPQKEIDKLLEEIIETGSKLNPVSKDRFLNTPAMAEMGISQESLSIAMDKLTATREKEAQAKEFKNLLSEATQLQHKGEIDKALELLDSKVKEVKLKDKATEFSSLMIPIKEEELKERQANKPESLDSGYTIGGEALLLPSGAISVFTAPTSHGKTSFLINLALNVAIASPDKETYLFSYEEDGDSILINTLNTYINEELSGNNRTTLKNCFAGLNKRTLPEKKDNFFKELIETRKLNIHYSSYNSDTLIEAIRYLHKHAKPNAIFIDYIQLLNLPEGKYKTYSRQEEIKEICIALKDVAVETGLPIILGAQFNREVVNQLRLHATKIGEAGDIERIANLIVGFWNNNFKPLATEGELNEINNKNFNRPNTIYATILKNRGGRVGLEEILSFNGNTGKISNNKQNFTEQEDRF